MNVNKMQWCIERECERCFGVLKIHEYNLECRNGLMAKSYYTLCDNCNKSLEIPISIIPEEVQHYAENNPHPQIVLSEPVHVSVNEYKIVHRNCRGGGMETNIVHLNDLGVDLDITFDGSLEYRVYYQCHKCDVEMTLTRIIISPGSHMIANKYKYAIYQNYFHLRMIEQHTRTSRKLRKAFFSCICYPFYNCI